MFWRNTIPAKVKRKASSATIYLLVFFRITSEAKTDDRNAKHFQLICLYQESATCGSFISMAL